MTRSDKSGSFEDFVRWLGERTPATGADLAEPPPQVLAAARSAWQECQALQRGRHEELAARVRGGTYHEEVELMAAADADRNRWLPRLRTPNGFAISTLYPANSSPGSAPVGLLVECPVELIDVFKGQPVHVATGGQWIEIGEIDIDGKAMGDLPTGIEFKPPFGFRVGKLAEEPTELPNRDESE